MKSMKKMGIDIVIGAIGIIGSLTLQEALAVLVSVSSLILIWKRILSKDKDKKDI